MSRIRLVALLLLLDLALVAENGAAQTGGGLPPGVTREQMWPAPTARDWQKPCLVHFERSYEDAVAVAQATGKPILVCVNMDGEIASEHYAGVRYRQPETAKLYEPYVCVIASVYRHNPRDHDEQGRRIPCPRFGSVTCGEHIAIEPGLFARFFDGERVAPRHIGVELDQQEMYDVYYAWDTDTIFHALRDGIANRPVPPNVVRGDRPILERVASRDSEDRTAVESAYDLGDAALKRSLLEAALAHPEAAPVDLLRLAVFGFDTDLSKLARRALAQVTDPAATDLIGEALRVPMARPEREALVGALQRIGQSSPRARMLAVVHQGLASRSQAVDVERWSQALHEAPAIAEDATVIAARIENQAKVIESNDPAQHIELAEAFLARALEPDTEPQFARLLYLDAESRALDAERLGAYGWRVNAAIAEADFHLGKLEAAHARAERAAGLLPPDVSGRGAMIVLALFAEARWQRIRKAILDKTDWPAEWLTDLNAAYSVLEQHPLGTDAQVAGHHDLLKYLGALGQAAQVLDAGLARFPESALLHERLRSAILAEEGVGGLEPRYEAMLSARDAAPGLEALAGYASLVAAELERRSAHEPQALAAYDRAIAHYQRSIARLPESRAVADHYIALALAGRARVAYEQNDDTAALSQLLESFARKPESAATLDGLGISPVATAQMLLSRLTERNQQDLASKLQAALDALDPELLRPPAFETQGPPPERGPGARRRTPGGGSGRW
ncbi:MAG: hypothetical protein U1E76_06305 [Planctomycetota bacterium]